MQTLPSKMASMSTSPQAFSLEDCKGEIYSLYIGDKLSLSKVMQRIEGKYQVKETEAVYKKKMKKWGFGKNTKRSVVLAVLREKEKLRADDEEIAFYLGERPVDMEKIEKFRKREKVQQKNYRGAPNAESSTPIPEIQGLVKRTRPKSPLLEQPTLPESLRLPERFVFDMSNYIKGSFETKAWKMNGTEQIIFSSTSQELDVHTLHSFLTKLDTGCSNFTAGNRYAGGLYWRKAFMEIEPLVKAQYHDIIPNIIQKINDLNEGGHPQFAEALKNHVAYFGMKRSSSSGDIQRRIYKALGEVSLEKMRNFEEMVMKCFSDLFEFYLGDRCYNSFVMKMDMARRRLSQGDWVDINDSLPTLTVLDYKFGPTDRRPLDIIRLRVETLFQRKQYSEARIHSSTLIHRAESIENDEWQRHYFLIKGLYYAGLSSYWLPENQIDAELNLSRCFDLIEDFYRLNDNFAMFDTEKVEIIERSEELARLKPDEEGWTRWNDRRMELQDKLNAMDNTIEMLEELQMNM